MPPIRVEEQYAKAIVNLLHSWFRKSYKDVIAEAPKLAAERAATKARLDSPEQHKMTKLIGQAAATMRATVNKPQLAALANKFANQTQTFQRQQLHDQVHDALGVDIDKIHDPDISGRSTAFIRENVRLISRIPAAQHEDVEAMVLDAVRGAKPGKSLGDDIRDRFAMSERHARFIARDQIGKYHADVNHTRQRALGVRRFIWRTVGDERVRGDPSGKYPTAEPSHFDLDGEMFDYDDPPVPPGADGPLLPGQDYSCFPGETLVSSQSSVQILYRRRYRGEGTVIKTDQGRVLTSTPNHPILTARGWVQAHLVQVGDYVIETASKSNQVSIVDGEHRDASFEELFTALAPLVSLKVRPGANTWFHGDATLNEQIDVVEVNRCLLLERDLELAQTFCQDLLTCAYRPGLGEGFLDLLFVGHNTTATSFVRSGSQLLSLLLGRSEHASEHRLTTITWLKTVADKLCTNSGSRDAQLFRDALYATTVGMELAHHFARVVFCVVSRAIMQSPRLNTPSAERLAEIVAVHAESLGDLRDSRSKQKFSCVVEKLGCVLDTHVYNLQTESSWYVAQNLVVHNCRCYAEPVLDDLLDDDEDDEDPDDTDDDLDDSDDDTDEDDDSSDDESDDVDGDDEEGDDEIDSEDPDLE